MAKTDSTPTNPDDLVTIVHKDVGGGKTEGVCSRHQLDTVWAELGWSLKSDNPDDVTAAQSAQANPAEPVV